jgi:hypothetical protein
MVDLHIQMPVDVAVKEPCFMVLNEDNKRLKSKSVHGPALSVTNLKVVKSVVAGPVDTTSRITCVDM